MIPKKFPAAVAFCLLAACLYGQGLTTSATPRDWEEINFEFDSSILSDGYPSLLRLAELLGKNPGYRVRIVGHTDSIGSSRYNEKLSLARANAVRDFLVKYGAPAGQLTTAAEGLKNPKVNNRSKEGRFINRRVVMTVTDPQGQVVGDGGVGEAIGAFDKVAKAQEECCTKILSRLDKLDEILAAVRDLKMDNDRLRGEVAALQKGQADVEQRIAGLPKPLTEQQTVSIAQAEGARVLEEQQRRNRKFSLLGLNIGPTYGEGRTGDFTFSGRGQFFSPFGGDGQRAVQAQGEYMYYPGRQEGQFDIGLVNRWRNFQAGAFGSFKFLNFREFQSGGSLAQGSVTLDWLFSRGKVGVFGAKGFKNNAVLNRQQLGPNSFLETYARLMNQVGAGATIGLAGNSYVQGNLAYLQSHGLADRAGANLKFVQPINDFFAFTAEASLNETLVNYNALQAGRVVFGVEMGNFLRPKEYASVTHAVPVDVPRVRYELLTRRVGNSPPAADAGPDQIGVPAGTVTLNGGGSSDPEGDALTFQWSQVSGPSVALAGANTAVATFTAVEGQVYNFRLTVRDAGGMVANDTVTVTTRAAGTTRILRFSAEPSTVSPGQVARLSWLTEGAEEVTITPGPGRVDPRSGTVDVTPSQTTTYRLTARGGGEEISSDVVITVSTDPSSGPRIFRFEATPTNITLGEATTLSWTTEGATEVNISGIGRVDSSGSRVVNPTETTTYTLTARTADGRQVTTPLIVTVGSAQVPRILQFAALPASVAPGQSTRLCWQVDNATEVSISPTVGAGLAASDCATVTPSETTNYTLTARNAAGQITATALVTAGAGQVRILSFNASPSFSSMAGGPVTLQWTTEGATSVTLTGVDVPTGTLDVNGSFVVRPVSNTTYTLTAYGPGESVSAVFLVFVR